MMDVKKIRCDLHQIPEVGRCEIKTKEYILNIVKALNCTIYEPTKTAVVIEYNIHAENTLCFRADMDALPVEELNAVSYASRNKGIMHACGHDGHMAMLLSFAIWASDNLNKLKHNIICLFQPSEEDDAGARDIIESNILDKLSVDYMFGFHIWPNLDKNKIYTMSGGMLATSGEVNITVHGKGVHAANRSQGIDALYIASSLVLEFYNEMDKVEFPHLVNFGYLKAGTVRNSVAQSARLEATMRAFDDESFSYMQKSLENLIHKLEKEYSTSIELHINAAYPSVINTDELVDKYKNLLDLNILTKPFLQAEDFGCYTRKYKSLFMLLGCGDEHLLHTPTFDFDMNILETGVEAYKTIAMTK